MNGQKKFIKSAKNGLFFGEFSKPEACGQTVLLDRSILFGQKLVENAKIEPFKCDILDNFMSLNWVFGLLKL